MPGFLITENPLRTTVSFPLMYLPVNATFRKNIRSAENRRAQTFTGEKCGALLGAVSLELQSQYSLPPLCKPSPLHTEHS